MPVSRDPQLLLSIQIALMGIVLVVGFFFVWRAISRIEARLDDLSSKECRDINSCIIGGRQPVTGSEIEERLPLPVRPSDRNTPMYVVSSTVTPDDDNDDGEDDVDIMKACFGDIPIQSLIDEAAASFVIFNGGEIHDNEEESGVVLEEIHEDIKNSSNKNDIVENQDEEGSVVGAETSEFSRNKLRKMHLDALKDLCSSRGLATDGTKAALVDRILSSLPSN